MRLYLSNTDLSTESGKQLLDLAVRIAADGKIDLNEIKELRSWLKANQQQSDTNSIQYLSEIMNRITADSIIDRDELLELHRAIERVIPASHRIAAVQSRKKREVERKQRLKVQRELEKQQQKAQEIAQREQEIREYEAAQRKSIRHSFAKVAGVTFQNEDGTERQDVLRFCASGEQLILVRDEDNDFSCNAVEVRRLNGLQLGYAPEYLAERIVDEMEDDKNVHGILKQITGGTYSKPTRGANFVSMFVGKDVTQQELYGYWDREIAGRDEEQI
jgi:hypothetical protein